MAKISKIAMQCGFTPHDVRPSDYNHHDNCSGDCTTRAMVFALEGKMNYHQVEDEQYRLAKVCHTVRNATGTYDRIMLKEGWRWIQLSKPMSRGEIAVRLAKRIPNVTAMTLSRTHIACVRGGNLIDTWDSRGGMVFGIMLPREYVHDAILAIDTTTRTDIEYKELPIGDTPRLPRHHRHTVFHYWG